MAVLLLDTNISFSKLVAKLHSKLKIDDSWELNIHSLATSSKKDRYRIEDDEDLQFSMEDQTELMNLFVDTVAKDEGTSLQVNGCTPDVECSLPITIARRDGEEDEKGEEDDEDDDDGGDSGEEDSGREEGEEDDKDDDSDEGLDRERRTKTREEDDFVLSARSSNDDGGDSGEEDRGKEEGEEDEEDDDSDEGPDRERRTKAREEEYTTGAYPTNHPNYGLNQNYRNQVLYQNLSSRIRLDK